MRTSCRWNNRLARAVIALCTPSVSQMAYPTENVIWPGCNMLQLPEPKGKAFACMSTTIMLHTPSTRVNIEIISYSNRFQRSQPSVHRRSSSYAGLDAGWLWLAVPPTSRNARLLPLSSRKLARPEPKWPGRVGPRLYFSVAWAKMACGEWLRLRRSFLISSNGCIQSIPRKRRPPKLHHLTSAFPLLISILL